MPDQQKTREQLIGELQDLRSRLAELEERIAEKEEKPPAPQPQHGSRSHRRELPTEIHVIGDFSLIQARGVNVSESGICFEVNYDIPFEMEFEQEGELHQHRAHLVWMRQLEDGRNQFGFQFVPSDTPPLFSLLR